MKKSKYIKLLEKKNSVEKDEIILKDGYTKSGAERVICLVKGE